MDNEQIKKLSDEKLIVLDSLFKGKTDAQLTAEEKKRKAIYADYLYRLQDLENNAKLEIANNKVRKKRSLEGDREEAREMIEKMISERIYPIVTVPAEFWPNIQSEGGLSAHKTKYLPDFKKIVGTLGVGAYNPQGRVLLQIECDPNDLEPRMTGSNLTYHGIVGYTKNFVPLEKIKLLQ
ncbi:MAG: hypothetical protein NTZ49_00195 [Candidatus Parcubacteria bacterium]|nr:hypothetical protein [Candidatus Parcubacteria bacterium]